MASSTRLCGESYLRVGSSVSVRPFRSYVPLLRSFVPSLAPSFVPSFILLPPFVRSAVRFSALATVVTFRALATVETFSALVTVETFYALATVVTFCVLATVVTHSLIQCLNIIFVIKDKRLSGHPSMF